MKSSFTTALIAAVVSAVVAAGAAVATTQTFMLGTNNRVDAASNVTNVRSNGTVNSVDAPLLTLENKSTSANATPLSLLAAPNHAALKVNTQTKIANLNADSLDGRDSTAFLSNAVPAQGVRVGEAWHDASFQPLNTPCAHLTSTQCPWMNYGSGFNTTGYYKDPLGVVHLRGLITPDCRQSVNISCTPDQVVFTLPAGYRPAAREVEIAATALISAQYPETARLDIDSGGNVVAVSYNDSAGNNAWISLDGITFRAAS